MKEIQHYQFRLINGLYQPSDPVKSFNTEVNKKVVLIVDTPDKVAILKGICTISYSQFKIIKRIQLCSNIDPKKYVLAELWNHVDEFERSSRKRAPSPEEKDVGENYVVLLMECENMKGRQKSILDIIKKHNKKGAAVLRVGIFKNYKKFIKNDKDIETIEVKTIEKFFEDNKLNEE